MFDYHFEHKCRRCGKKSMKNAIRFYWCKVYGLGIAVERSYVLDCDECTYSVFHGKLFLGPLMVDFSLWLA